MRLTPIFRDALQAEAISASPELRSFDPSNYHALTSQGLSHDHVRINGSGYILRIPRENQLGMEPADYLDLQFDCYQQGAKSGHVPSAHAIIKPSDLLPNGALIVQDIAGARKTTEPEDRGAIAIALANMHKLKPPAETHKLSVADYPFSSQLFLIQEVFGDAIEKADISKRSQTLLNDEKSRVVADLQKMDERVLPRRYIGGDSHPGNFLINKAGKAFMVDVEFAMYDSPYIDVADASMPLTQRLEPDVTMWTDAQRHNFVQTWAMHAGKDIGNDMKSLDLAQRAVRLRTLLWLANWNATGFENNDPQITLKARGNWDRMEKTYLQENTLEGILEQNNYPYLPPFKPAI